MIRASPRCATWPFPKLLDPVDDLPPNDRHHAPHPDRAKIRSLCAASSSDNGTIAKVFVNGDKGREGNAPEFRGMGSHADRREGDGAALASSCGRRRGQCREDAACGDMAEVSLLQMRMAA
jgi:hypothetical protein